ncbi:hypothetical protein A5634_19490 [Mycobacterium asiaticum]|uniref:CARDB domain-containing protein n=1 Tax=Mycobacterium asiaticum TaxID=1790 RepID=A0A1A3P8C0_MYCAS|nr:hypothetical protein [Mycobacterium asiaticum]OBK28832.1 hypothetical protein A5634_19490 [Mycobacterium asiaticum]
MSKIPERSGKTNTYAAAVTAALTLGLFTTVLAPGAATAAPSGSLPDLVAGTRYSKPIDVGESATIPIVVENQGKGATGANGIDLDLQINLGPGLGLLDLQPTAGQGWYCSNPVRSGDNGATKTNCSSIKPLQPGQTKTIKLRVHGETNQKASAFWLVLAVDSKHRITESNEANNDDLTYY